MTLPTLTHRLSLGHSQKHLCEAMVFIAESRISKVNEDNYSCTCLAIRLIGQ